MTHDATGTSRAVTTSGAKAGVTVNATGTSRTTIKIQIHKGGK
jgi:hypothetical protein